MLQRGDPLRVQLAADFFVRFPVEVFRSTGPLFIEPSDLDLSAGLVEDLLAWQQWFDEHTDLGHEPIEQGSADEWDRWREDGARLAERL